MLAATRILIALLPALLFSGCQTTDTQIEPSQNKHYAAAPAMRYASAPQNALPALSPNPPQSRQAPSAALATHPSPKLSPSLTGRYFLTASHIENELAAQARLAASQIEFSDRLYVLPSHDWLTSRFLPHIRQYFRENKILNIGEGLDCDNIAQLFRQQLILSNAQGGGARAGDIPCGILKTLQRSDFGGVPGNNTFHSLILLRTDKGWFAIEPQTQAIATLKNYPNTPHIDWAFF